MLQVFWISLEFYSNSEVRTSGVLTVCQSIWRNIPEELNVCQSLCENVKSRITDDA